MVTFPQLESWIRAGDIDSVVTGLLALDEPARRALAAPVKGIQLHWSDPELQSIMIRLEARRASVSVSDVQWRRGRQRDGALCVAGVACLPRAADVVSWLRSDRFRQAPLPETLDAVVRLLRSPGRPSLPAIARSMADKFRPAQIDEQWPLIERLLAEAELPLPVTEATVRGWMRRVGADRYREDLAGLLRADPLLERLLPHVFTIPLLGQELDEEWTRALARLAAEGAVDRQSLLDGCALRLHSGDRPGVIARVVVLHRLLDPTPGEFAARRAEYAGMLAGPHSTVAELAQLGLRAADDAGLLEPDTVAEAAFAVLPRKEKKLVRVQLGWLDAALTRKPDPLVFEALLTGLTNPAGDLAERALRVAARHLADFGPAERDMLAATAAGLRGDLRRQADALLGATGDTAGVPEATIGELTPVAAPTPMPAPIASIPELVAECRHQMYQAEDPVRFELILDGLARFAATDRGALVKALKPILPQWRMPFPNLLHTIVSGEQVAEDSPWWPVQAAPPHWMLVERMDELARQMCRTPPAALLATPATVKGHVDPSRVLRLLGDGAEPGPVDLSQALLRLPREVDPDVRAAAGRLTSPAGKAFAAYLEGGGLPDPDVVTLRTVRRPCAHVVKEFCDCATAVGRRTVAFEPIGHQLTGPPHLLHLPADAAFDRAYGFAHDTAMGGWPLMFPSHREIAAAHVQPHLIKASEYNGASSQIAAVLPALAASDGPFGPAMALCLAYGFSAARAEGRLATADAFVELAARGVLDGALVGRELAALHRSGALVLKRVADALATILQAGAAIQVWAVLRESLPAVLTTPKPAAGASDLLMLAESVAAATNATDDFPEVTALAARPGRSRLITEAARLSRTLTENRAR
ncbi:DUF6493 family protein [Actinoplanes sp. NEAU-A12]|uniref:DUF6493 family protein n=1 Tax=Actinoplanes sandaracinus TaxID=3045177 RepID=A0ABT6WR47_9ACTN|nr:DUF6493 family protein [Actinoplanes sandaracinus]MDI6102171.1 DUF6493 family protein [Actinoplanes sandaracinus]